MGKTDHATEQTRREVPNIHIHLVNLLLSFIPGRKNAMQGLNH